MERIELALKNLTLEVSQNNINNNLERSIECFADNVKFACVWQQPEVNMHIINQVLNQLTIFNDNSYGDYTTTNISALLSASFPSCEAFDGDENNADESESKNVTVTSFEASTPISTIKNSYRECNGDASDEAKDFETRTQMLLLAFNNTSPIVFTSRNRALYTKKRLQLS